MHTKVYQEVLNTKDKEDEALGRGGNVRHLKDNELVSSIHGGDTEAMLFSKV